MRLRTLVKYLRPGRGEREDFLLPGKETFPPYIAIIMDGNGRWAKGKNLPAIAGHREGARTLKRIIKASRRAGVKELTVYAFSTENWMRPQDEVDELMKMFSDLIDKETPELNERGVRMKFIGRRSRLSPDLLEKMDQAEKLTENNEQMTLYVAFNYGGRAELVDAVEAACKNGFSGHSEMDLKKYMYAPEMHDPELLIRTSGEQRISNFLLWQCAYAELYFSDKYWPDFSEEDLIAAFQEFKQRQRRFGTR